MKRQMRPALVLFALLSVTTGVVYPLVVTVAAQVAMPARANGSIVEQGGVPVGSDLIGQPFRDPRYFRGRPSATLPEPYAADASAGSNLAPSNPALRAVAEERIRVLREADPGNLEPIPVDLVTASASGLDPHISPAAAAWQVRRVATARGLTPEQVSSAVAGCTEGRFLGVLGEPRVNVARLNRALDGMR